ncbi:hypothetical protein FKW77_003780 [Venturia effusa]|uniref:Uncharacterized protein n=1 Tax=Venturia effusa TaxID=50376 RepID=A0A517LL80_9PEZI|nr:hypothetical protein FKW77_003780 [Venturia effusa]
MEISQGSDAQEDAQSVAYDALVQLFAANIDKVLDIEILPSSAAVPNGQIFFEDELGVGIPKKVLVAAFIKAREVFADRSNNANDQSYQKASRATPILLLFDPEYLTAANFRKKQILSLPREHDGFQLAVKRELIFLDSVLTSPLHRQSKSPTLWYHRYWLIRESWRHLCPTDDLAEDFLKHEFAIIFRSAERHQHNYYAWQYARRLVSLLEPTLQEDNIKIRVKDGVLEESFAWCLQHPSDTSGWSFLLFLMQRPLSNTEQIITIMRKTIDFAATCRWSKDALWHFLRTALLMTEILPENSRTRFIDSTGVKPIGSKYSGLAHPESPS